VLEFIKKHSTLLKIIFFALILFFVVNQVTNILHDMSWADVVKTIEAQSPWAIVGMFGVGMIGVIPMLLYDYVVVKSLERAGKPKMPRMSWFVSAWTTNTINNLAGFGGMVGASLRSSFYSKGIEKKRTLATVSKVAIFMVTGLSLWAGITAFDLFFIHPNTAFINYRMWLALGFLVFVFLVSFVVLKRKTLFKEFSRRELITLFVASFGQWTGAMLVFLVVGYMMGLDFTFSSVYALFVISTGLGMITMVPGGAGTFDIMMILGLGHLGLAQGTAVVWLLFYRIFYYILPFLSGLVIFLSHTGVKVNRYLDNLPKNFSQKAAHLIVVFAVYFAGILMVLLSTFTNLSNISALFQWILPYSFNFLDQTLNMLVGFLLLGLARGISQKVRQAYLPTLLLLGFCIINTVTRTASIRLVVVYILIAMAVFLSRKEFYREKLVYSWEARLFDGLLFGVLFIIYTVAGYFSGQFLWTSSLPTKVLAFPTADIWRSGMFGMAFSIVGLALLYQFLASSDKKAVFLDWEEERFNELLARFGGTSASHYLRLPGYKYYYYQENGVDQVMFGFQVKANKCFVLGDPVGDYHKWQDATRAFMTELDCFGYQPAFYKVSKRYVIVLHDFGYRFDKIGETGIVHFDQAPDFTQTPEILEMVERGFTYKYFAAFPKEDFPQLRAVSDDWLQGHKEKGFGVGRFDEHYLESCGIGVAYFDGQIVGFISIQPIKWVRCSYDLLRFNPEIQENLASFLLVQTLATLKAQGFKQVDLGLAPLANVGDSIFSFSGERLMNTFYKFGSPIYAFQQVAAEKETYVAEWRPRYFAYRKNSNFIFSSFQLLTLIGRGKNKGPTLADDVMIEL
jgi:phosphatidylglycerol lysyltransferase